MTWEPIPLTVFGRALPARSDLRGYLSCARARTQARNAIRIVISGMMTFEGSGDMQNRRAGPVAIERFGQQSGATLERRWISIPQNVWHRPVVGKGGDWTVVSFHTVPAEELIEEKLDDSSQDGTKQMKYLERK